MRDDQQQSRYIMQPVPKGRVGDAYDASLRRLLSTAFYDAPDDDKSTKWDGGRGTAQDWPEGYRIPDSMLPVRQKHPVTYTRTTDIKDGVMTVNENGKVTTTRIKPTETMTQSITTTVATAVETAPAISQEILSKVLLKGDLSGLNDSQKFEYAMGFARSVGLNPSTMPFKILKLQGKEVLYADKGLAEQLRSARNLSFEKPEYTSMVGEILSCTIAITDGIRTDYEEGAVSIAGLKGEALANARMKALTKAKRRATLSFCGLGMLDESEISSIPQARSQDIEQAPAKKLKAKEVQPELPIETLFTEPLMTEDQGFQIDVLSNQREMTIASQKYLDDSLDGMTVAKADKCIAWLKTLPVKTEDFASEVG